MKKFIVLISLVLLSTQTACSDGYYVQTPPPAVIVQQDYYRDPYCDSYCEAVRQRMLLDQLYARQQQSVIIMQPGYPMPYSYSYPQSTFNLDLGFIFGGGHRGHGGHHSGGHRH